MKTSIIVLATCASLTTSFACAQQPDFTGVWTTYNEPGQAGGGTRRRTAAADDRCGEAEGREVSGARQADRRHARRLLPRHRHARIDARLGRLSDGDPSAPRADHHRLRGAQRGSSRLSRRSHRARRSIGCRAGTATRAAAGKATRWSSRRRISSSRSISDTRTATRRRSSSAITSKRREGRRRCSWPR